MLEKIFDYMIENGFKFTTVALIVIVIVILSHLEDTMIFVSRFWGLFSKSYSFAQKKQISNSVRGTILKSIKRQQIKDNNIMLQDLKVVWTNKEEPDSFVKNNQVIVRIKQSSNSNDNLVTAVSEYVNNGLLYNVRRYLNKEVIDASKILMTRKLIESSDRSSLTYLDENYIIPKMKQDSELKELYEDLVKIDNNGMFIGIMLNEFNKAGLMIYNQIEDPLLVAESKEFMRYLYDIAAKISTEPKDLNFNREYFKVAIILTTNTRTLNRSGIQPFINVINKMLTDGIETIYIFGLGRKREVAESVSNEVNSDFRVDKVIKHTYKHVGLNGKRTPGVFFECQIYKESHED